MKKIEDYTANELSKKIEDTKTELKQYEKELKSRKIASDNPIDIHFLLPLLKKGYVAMDASDRWFWYKRKPLKETEFWSLSGNPMDALYLFNIKPAENWETSLMECGI